MRGLLLTVIGGLLVLLIAQLVGYAERRLGSSQPHIDGRMTRRSRFSATVLVLIRLLVSVPIAVLIALAATPLWWLLEWITGWHIVGHAGPDEWYYLLVFAVVVVVYVRRPRRMPDANDPAATGGGATHPQDTAEPR